MSLTVTEKIAEVIKTRLTELIDGDELTQIDEVIIPKVHSDFTPKDNQIVVTTGDTEIIPELSYPGNPPATCWETTFNIRCRVMPSDSDTDSKVKLSSQIWADVVKAITTPQATWHTFDANAIDANFGAISNTNSEAMESVTVPLVVRYRTDENNPYEVRA